MSKEIYFGPATGLYTTDNFDNFMSQSNSRVFGKPFYDIENLEIRRTYLSQDGTVVLCKYSFNPFDGRERVRIALLGKSDKIAELEHRILSEAERIKKETDDRLAQRKKAIAA